MSNRFLNHGIADQLNLETTQSLVLKQLEDINLVHGGNTDTLASNPIDLNIGNAGAGTQRVVIASNQPTVNVNSHLINVMGTAISVNSGATDAGTQRVILPTDQPPVSTNITQINGQVVSQGLGVSTTGTQRVIPATDQPRMGRLFCRHRAANVFSTEINVDYMISHDADSGALTVAKDYGSKVSPGAVFILSCSSASANDTSAGSGARTITLNYYSGILDTTFETIQITMNGQTEVITTATDFYRFHSAFVNTAGASNSNEDTIYFYHPDATVTAGVPDSDIISVISIEYNRSNYANWFIPRMINYPYIVFDYLNVGVSTDNIADDILKIEARETTVSTDNLWITLQENHFFQADSNFLSQADIRNLVLDTNLGGGHGYDIRYSYNHPTASDFSMVISLGYHYSQNPY